MSLEKLKNFGSSLVTFIKNVANDERIPSRDKKILLALMALVVSPIDLIPDWVPVFGLIDDVVILALVLDYFFDVLDQEIILTHYPWDMKSYVWLRRAARTVALMTPRILKERLWAYKPDIYKG